MKKIIVLLFVFCLVTWSTRFLGLLLSFTIPDRVEQAAYKNENREEIVKWRSISKVTHSSGYIMMWNIIGVGSGLIAVKRKLKTKSITKK